MDIFKVFMSFEVMHFTDFKNLLFHNDILFIKQYHHKSINFLFNFSGEKEKHSVFPMSVNSVANLDSYSQVNENIL